ncbi:hypothetical protein EYF80_055282 [Liparis tanakae]|uniref:Secreted protein n=1 Tax=Liparis tanakae TaxID=230148 RepID=A0A4Z2F242_9TELE|nr:hypothetical protein EYF80_055282 [Liparis tanakae]
MGSNIRRPAASVLGGWFLCSWSCSCSWSGSWPWLGSCFGSSEIVFPAGRRNATLPRRRGTTPWSDWRGTLRKQFQCI